MSIVIFVTRIGLSNYAFVEFYTTDDAQNWLEANKVRIITMIVKYICIVSIASARPQQLVQYYVHVSFLNQLQVPKIVVDCIITCTIQEAMLMLNIVYSVLPTCTCSFRQFLFMSFLTVKFLHFKYLCISTSVTIIPILCIITLLYIAVPVFFILI